MDVNKIIQNQFLMIEENPNSTRSNKITYELHKEIKEELKKMLGDQYEVIAQDTKEEKVEGLFGSKKCDITIKRENKVLGVVAVKVIRSSYKKNANNYFENMIGETINLKLKDIKVMQLIIIPEVTLYRSKGQIKKEIIGDTQLLKYLKLDNSNMIYKPDLLHVHLVKIDYDNDYNTKKSELEYIKDEELKVFLSKKQNLNNSLKIFSEVIKNEN